MTLTIGIYGQSSLENEFRLPIHPQHFSRIDAEVARSLYVEVGYGLKFGVSDSELAQYVGGVLDRAELIARCDIILLPKMQAQDLAALRDGQTVWGWPHCVQDIEIAQLAIDKRLTLIAFEAMNHWNSDGSFGLHVFHKNNELAGYASVLHSMQLMGVTGDYGRRLTAAVIGFGATARGAVTALNAHGVHDVRVLTMRNVSAVASPIHSAQIVQIDHADDEGGGSYVTIEDDGRKELAPYLAESDIVVNCTLQDPENPVTFLTEADLAAFQPGSLIVDVSCDEGMGFSWAKPSTFNDPMRVVGNQVHYYAVDHTPSMLWNSATWEISEALLGYLDTVIAGPAAWQQHPMIKRAIEIQDGMVLNPAVLAFQGRAAAYPHDRE
ncbi:alanine dehydrogenase [Leucobacter exalbidus]|uniref:Alanine dehydrogenase n=1 Tax=Leucobacter exalbidus TaxID=662960 RepID=A0A940PQC2_9MICO|nr:N(5)-(carboxyethyl)ornithine synthase [Leucobacter exalbidus]MBP1327205.1 alanine dehydrogenase [Leucobacter exalbidus]